VLALLGAASADCERIGSSLLEQPVNAWSSLAFLTAGLWVAWRAVRASSRRAELGVFAVAIAVNAAGGILYHGFDWPASRWVHDLAIMSVLVFIAVFALGELRGWATMLGAYRLGLAGVGAFLALAPGSTDVLSALLAVAIGVWEVAEYRRELPLIRAEGLTARRVARLAVLVALALGGTAFLVGRAGAPLCDPSSVVQWHAVWHVLAAAAMALYAFGAIETHPVESRDRG
jgi:hypothetical protein